ncbi:MAG: Nitrite-sensitive transcriptional repressor NsrR [Bryobacterales bacterium]|nr:Nitrite-sensitive transcriptional repressor NsrR [Bryobacterales bacterium]
MQLSLHADYALRVLIYVGSNAGKTVTTTQISSAYGISQNHLVRVVQTLGKQGYLKVTQGRFGGMTLSRDPADIRLGQVVRDAEPNMKLVECFDRETNTCPIAAVCGLKAYLGAALEAFIAELDKHTLSELLVDGRDQKLAAALVRITA